MTINIAEAEMLLSYAEEMASYGYRYAAYPVNKVNDSYTVEFFRTLEGAEDHCLGGPDDAGYLKSLSVNSLINDLNMVLHSGVDTSRNESFDINSYAKMLKEKKEILDNNSNTKTMNEKNLEYLKDQLKYTGFGETFDAELRENVLKGDKDFKIMHTGIMNNGLPNKDTLIVELNFKRSEQTDMYFFNSYHVNLQKEENKPCLEQTFYINKDSASITMKEAYNLMEGRSVNKELKNKEGESYNCWLKINFKESDSQGNFKLNQYHQNYGYDLEASVAKHSIKELNTPQYKDDLLNSLKKGNLQSATFVVGGVESKMYVEANPQFKTVNVYDANFQRINHRESKEEKKAESQKESVSKDNKQSSDSDEGDSGKKDNKVKKRKSPSL
ncbi:hypothetical protein [Flavobacterium anhuiense]|uniref:hypothetical protein n=1 Tax=Flavobacterium anhuiense TaxID=459526 RepID=UPI003D958972